MEKGILMKVIILAGGYGTRISEESHLRPKPMIEIGGRPILWHIMKIYSSFGFNDFVVCLGYKGQVVKEFFANYYLHMSDVTFDFCDSNRLTVHTNSAEPWRVTLVDTGLDTMTGGRVSRVRRYIGDETFLLTYGDGVGDIPVDRLVEFHRGHGKMATVTAIQPAGRFGSLEMALGGEVRGFREKPRGDGSWINGGFFVFEPSFFDLLSGDDCVLERTPLERAAEMGQLMAFRHGGFWQPMDTLRDKLKLEESWQMGHAPWKIWP